MHVTARPATVELAVGQAARFTVAITNTASTIDAYRVHVFGLDPQWITVEPTRLSLFPAATDEVAVTIALPDDFPAGPRVLAVHVQSENDATDFALASIGVAVLARPRATLQVDPVLITGGRRAEFGLVVANGGNATLDVVPTAIDPEDKAVITFDPAALALPPGRRDVVVAHVERRRPWLGQPKPRVLTFGVRTPEPVEAMGTFVQRPRISRWVLSLMGLALVAAVFAIVLSRTFDKVVDQASVNQDLILAALNQGGAAGAVVPVNPAVLAGKALFPSGAPAAGATAELFEAGNSAVPVATAATAADGSFAIGNLGAGAYKLKLSGAGLDAGWYPDAPSFADAEPINLEPGQPPPTLDEVRVAGRPGAVQGKVEVEDPTGATATLLASSTVEEGVDATVDEIDVSADGTFAFPTVPAPAVYRLVVEKEGYATEVRDVVLAAAQVVDDIDVVLRRGAGVVSGRVQTSAGPLGGATVTARASDGRTVVSTVSLTQGDVGFFAVRGLATPGIYSVELARAGYVAEARTITLGADQQVGDVVVTLSSSTGSLRGTVSLAGSGPLGGVTVTVAGQDVRTVTTTASQGAVGTFVVEDLPAPSSYTVTFSRAGLVDQTLLEALDPRTGTADMGGVDAALVPATATVRGVVRNVDGAPQPQATVALTDGTNTRTLSTADSPVGRFEFTGVAPGTYTLTASRTGTSPSVVLVNVAAAQVADLDVGLQVQASLFGNVFVRDPDSDLPVPFTTGVVRLFKAEEFRGSGVAGALAESDLAGGRYEFTGLDAPQNLVVAVYATPTASDPLDSQVVQTQPSLPVQVPDFILADIF